MASSARKNLVTLVEGGFKWCRGESGVFFRYKTHEETINSPGATKDLVAESQEALPVDDNAKKSMHSPIEEKHSHNK